MKIVSLLPSATEILYALGLGDSIIGVSHDCDYPPEVREKPVLSTSSISDASTSAEIDQTIGQTYHRGGSIYHLDPLFLEREQPDVIIAQELCQVCAVTSAEARQAAKIARSGARILSLEPSSLSAVEESIRVLGEAVGCQGGAALLAQQVHAQIEAVRGGLAKIESRPRVFCLGWLDPLIVEGHWIPEMVTLAGGRDGLGKPGGHSRSVKWEEVRTYDPEVILMMPCSFSLPRTLREAHLVGKLSGWGAVSAVQNGRVYAVDSGYFSRPGPRLVTGLRILARCLHPDIAVGALPLGAVAQLPAGAEPTAEAFLPVR